METISFKEASDILQKQVEDYKKKQKEYREKEFLDSCCSKCGYCFEKEKEQPTEEPLGPNNHFAKQIYDFVKDELDALNVGFLEYMESRITQWLEKAGCEGKIYANTDVHWWLIEEAYTMWVEVNKKDDAPTNKTSSDDKANSQQVAREE